MRPKFNKMILIDVYKNTKTFYAKRKRFKKYFYLFC